MRAGEMKYRLQLLKPTATTNDYGEEATTYEPIRTVWAERKNTLGQDEVPVTRDGGPHQ